jgi:BirA family biotin operon repressor/biotin-[acetyl-CoA-carboxylase] ligase
MPLLTLASAVGVARALEDEGAHPGIKWPNDVELDGRKVCGILTEAQAELDRLQYAVVGIGVNVNTERADFPPELRGRVVGLSEALGRPVDRVVFFRRLLRRLQEAHGNLSSGRADRVLREWRVRATVLGRQVKIHQGDRVLFGQALDVDDQGALLVRNDWGFTETVTAGDVETLRLAPLRRSRRPVRVRPGRL